MINKTLFLVMLSFMIIPLASADFEVGQIISQNALDNYDFSYSDFNASVQTVNGKPDLDCSNVNQTGRCILPINHLRLKRNYNNETGEWLGDYIIENSTYNMGVPIKVFLKLYERTGSITIVRNEIRAFVKTKAKNFMNREMAMYENWKTQYQLPLDQFLQEVFGI